MQSRFCRSPRLTRAIVQLLAPCTVHFHPDWTTMFLNLVLVNRNVNRLVLNQRRTCYVLYTYFVTKPYYTISLPSN